MNRKVHVYIIRNAPKRASGAPVKRQTISIVGPAIRSLIHAAGIRRSPPHLGTATPRRAGLQPGFHRRRLRRGAPEEFDTQYMRALFDYGFRQGRDGYSWKKSPP